MDALYEELGDIGGEWWWKTEKKPTEELRKAYDFEHLLILTRVYRDDDAADPAQAGPSQAKKAKRVEVPGGGSMKLIYPKPEDEAFHAHATWAFLFPAAVPEPTAVADRASKETQMRLAMCLPMAAATAVKASARRLVDALAKQ